MKQIFYSGHCSCIHCQDRRVHGRMNTADESVLGIESEAYPVSNLKLRNRTIAREESPVRQGPAKKWKYGRNGASTEPNVDKIIAVEIKDEPMDQQDIPDLDHIQPPPLLISKSNLTPAAGASLSTADQSQVTPFIPASGRTKRGRPPPRPKRENPRRQPQKLGRYVSGRGVKKIDWDKLLANYPNRESQDSDSDTESQISGGFKGFSDNEAKEIQVLAVKSKPPPLPPSPPTPPTSFTFVRDELIRFLEQAKDAVAPDPVPCFINPFMKVRPALQAKAPPQHFPNCPLWPRFNAPKSICEQVQSNLDLVGTTMKTSILAMIPPPTTQMQMRQCLSVGSQYDPEDIRRGDEIRREAQIEQQVLNDALDLEEEMYVRRVMEQPEDIEIDLLGLEIPHATKVDLGFLSELD